MDKVPIARECMSRSAFTLCPGMRINEAIDMLASRGASFGAVVDEDNQLVGLLTEKDCLRVLSVSAYAGLDSGHVRDYMSPVKTTVPADLDIFAVAQRFLATDFAELPVLDGDRLIGAISRQDMLRGIQRLERQTAGDRARRIHMMQSLQNPSSQKDISNVVGSHKKENAAALLSQRFRSREGD